MFKKRGFLIIVLFLIILSHFVFAVTINANKYALLGKQVNAPTCVWYCNTGSCDDCWYDDDGLYNYGFGWDSIDDGNRVGITLGEGVDGGDCNIGNKGVVPPEEGCRVIVVDHDSSPNNNDADGVNMKYGFILDYNYRDLTAQNVYFKEEAICDGGTDGAVVGARFKVDSSLTYVCSDDNFWHKCKGEYNKEANSGDLGSITWANNKIYNCTFNKDLNIPEWKEVPGLDVDHDGVPNVNDCNDNPSNDPPICKDLTSPDQCTLETSTCAICIHPGAVETCGDGVPDNDCNAEDNDNCNLFKEGCEQTSLPATKKGETDEAPGPAQRNIDGKSYSWIPTSDGGYCCGFNGVSKDLGKIQYSDKQKDNYLCLNKNFIGYEGDSNKNLPDWGVKISNQKGNTCSEDWCWIKASGDAAFHILTIKKPGETIYDVVSNSDQWMECNEKNKDTSISALLSGPNTRKANHFACYQEGNHWSWKLTN